jgi:hypothetical protein
LRDDDEYRALQERVYQLGELTRHPGWQVLVELTEQVTRAMKLRVLNGNFKSIDEYKSATGELQGVARVLDAPKLAQSMLDAEHQQRIESETSLT